MTEYKCLLLFFSLLLIIVLHFLSRRGKRKKLESIRRGEDALVKWSYTKDEWAHYAEDESSGWIKNKDVPGDVFIMPESIYVTNGSDEYFYEFGQKRVTNCTFYRSFLDLRVEWTSVDRGGLMEGLTRYHNEDFRLFVPEAKREEVLGLIEEFKAMINPA